MAVNHTVQLAADITAVQIKTYLDWVTIIADNSKAGARLWLAALEDFKSIKIEPLGHIHQVSQGDE
jgi:hypothetical protein